MHVMCFRVCDEGLDGLFAFNRMNEKQLMLSNFSAELTLLAMWQVFLMLLPCVPKPYYDCTLSGPLTSFFFHSYYPAAKLAGGGWSD